MGQWLRARDNMFSAFDAGFGMTRDSMGNTSFDLLGNMEHTRRMERDKDYRDAFNSLNGPASNLDLQTQTLMKAYDNVGQEYIDKKVQERETWKTWGSDYSAQDVLHERELGVFNAAPPLINEEYDPWGSPLIE